MYDNHVRFNELMQFISKNKTINNFVNQVNAHDTNAQALYNAIETGDFAAEIFSHPECSLYLLYLIKAGKIDFDTGITVYVYLMVLMQFTHQNLGGQILLFASVF
ncbi:hypothetical protein [Legionella clemsonensis]|uniref:Uncharacterized protein n=1 Tax=Legionella clemsonensis TaxID=1867846 RepID=A0A222P617_9GAMM|nr:hypothetical protein [Legionella clemsonensis]ASQ47296.1 hypothetical protein clem_13850 [Legionella clemsonensis]